ncbi:MAG TPA: PQQ-binding-like beta-propeller repeat protein [Candidatus Acidoferrales bacterium]|nr:PQQ-binding-like beta-propeller repeat protein [Candidatus Acidoferrales bacterium]
MTRKYVCVAATAAILGSLAWAGAARAQAPAQAPAQTPPPAGANLATGTETGIGTFQTHCMGCHGNPNLERVPSPDTIRQMSPERIYDALTTGAMKAQGDSLTDDQKRMLATFLSGRPLGSLKEGDAKDMPNHCAANPPLADPASAPSWNGWSADLTNTRFQTAAAAGITADQVPHLKLKWAFGYPTGLSAFGQPAVVSGRIFVGTDIGYVYSLDASTGCVYWSYQAKGSVRSAVSVARVKGHGKTKYAAFFGDAHANVYAVDAQNGQPLWTTRVDDHFVARITAAPKVYNGVVYIPVSSSEEFSASNLDYSCCTGRGSVVALDANTGKQVWKTYVVDTPKPVRKNSKGVQQYAPSGGSVWNSPTIDAQRHAIYFGTGDGQTEPAPDTTDAVMALNLKTGKVLWFYQAQAGDAFMGGCNGPDRTDNCPSVNGPDQDIGNSPILRKLPDGKSVVVFGMKDATVTALDPDRKGAVVWKVHAIEVPKGQENSFFARLNGVVWGGAADDQNVYYGLQSGGMIALKLATGERVWKTTFPKPETARVSNSAAGTAMPGVAFVAGSDGKLFAVSTADGKILWEYDTAQPFETVNKVAAKGGAINSIGPTIVNGMLFIGSGYAVTGSNSGNVLLAFSVQ